MSSADPAVTPQLFLERARDYVRRGFSVIPLGVGSKRPTVEWKEFQSRRPTDEELVAWFSSPANLGIVTGSISGVDVIDVDSDDALRHAAKLGLGTVPTVKTSKGWHFYYTHEPGVGNFQQRDDLPGIDLRAEGGYVVAPPSIHESGASYHWEGEHRELLPLPRWILSVQTSAHGANVVKTPIAALYDGASEGSRNKSLARLAGAWATSLPLPFALEAALFWNARRCNPPLDEREVERTVRSIYSKELVKRQELDGAGWAETTPAPVAPTDEHIVRVHSLDERVETLYRDGLKRGVSTGWEPVDELYTVRKGEWTVITGMPGHGKSTWLDQLVMNLARLHGWRFGVFSAENLPHEQHVARYLEKHIDKPFNEGPTTRITPSELVRGMDFLHEHLVFLNPPEEKQNVRTLLDLVDRLMGNERIDAAIIDPWNELDHSRPAQVTETEHISINLSILRRFARVRQIHLFVVAHPAKIQKDKSGRYPVPTLYDIAGSAHWRNKADNGIVIHRKIDVKADGEIVDRGVSEVIVQKIRFREVGRIGKAELYYDRITGRFRESRKAPWEA